MNDTRTGARALPQPIDAALVPRFAGIPTFMRLPAVTSPTEVDVALVGVPFDGGTTNRAGARHGPREIRNMSSFMRKVHHVSRIAPYELCRIADLQIVGPAGAVERDRDVVGIDNAVVRAAAGFDAQRAEIAGGPDDART